MAKPTLTDAKIKDLKPAPDRRLTVADPQFRSLYVRVQPSGKKSFAVVARDPSGKQIWTTIGPTEHVRVADAREQARKIIARVKAGLPAVEVVEKPQTFGEAAERWLRRHVEGGGLRSAKEYRRLLSAHVLPMWCDRPLTSIRRREVNDLLDAIADDHGPRTSDYTLAVLRSFMTWQQSRDESYASPIVAKMRRGTPGKRDRILSDDELRRVWAATEGPGTFNAIVRLLLLTGQRREKVSAMCWDQLDGNVWHVPHEDRQKGVGGALVLPPAAMAIIESQPRIEGCPYVFSGRAGGAFAGWSKAKASLDHRSGVDAWCLHDLRRSARSLMARAGVRPDVCERVLGHVQPGIVGVYDRFQYRDEKGEALRRLADLVARIVEGPQDNVITLAERR